MDGGGRECCPGYGPCPHHDTFSYAAAYASGPPPTSYMPPTAFNVTPMSTTLYPPPCATLYRVMAQSSGVPLVESLPTSVSNMHVSHVSTHSDDLPGPAIDRRPKRVRDVSTDEEQCASQQNNNTKGRPKIARVNSMGTTNEPLVQVDDGESFDTVEPELESLQSEDNSVTPTTDSAIVIDLTDDTNAAASSCGLDRPHTPQPPRSSSRQSRSSSTLDSQANRRSESASSTQQHREPIASPLLDGSGRPSLHRCARGAPCSRVTRNGPCRHQCQCAHACNQWCPSCVCPPCGHGHCPYSTPSGQQQQQPLPPPPPPPPYMAGGHWESAANIAASVHGYIGNYHTIYGAYPSFLTATPPVSAPGPTLYVSASQNMSMAGVPSRTTAPVMGAPLHRRASPGLAWPEPTPIVTNTRPDVVHHMAPDHRRVYHSQQVQRQRQREYFEQYHQQRRRHVAGPPPVFHSTMSTSDQSVPPPMVLPQPPPNLTASALSLAAAAQSMQAAFNAQLMEGMLNGVHAIRQTFPQPVEVLTAASHAPNMMPPILDRHYVLVAPPGGAFTHPVPSAILTAQNPIEVSMLIHPTMGFEGDVPPVGASVEVIERVTRIKQYNKPTEVVQGEEERCTVCLSEFETEEHVRMLQCTHFFHKGCIDRWLMHNKTCPVCRLDCDRYVGHNLS